MVHSTEQYTVKSHPRHGIKHTHAQPLPDDNLHAEFILSAHKLTMLTFFADLATLPAAVSADLDTKPPSTASLSAIFAPVSVHMTYPSVGSSHS